MRKLLLALCCAFCLSTATANANPIHDMQNSVPTDKALHLQLDILFRTSCKEMRVALRFEAFLIASRYRMGKRKIYR